MADGKSKGCGCLIFAGAAAGLAAAVVFAWYLGDVSGIQTLHALDESSYEPLAGFEYARGLVGDDSGFVQLSAAAVGPNGTVDLTADGEPTVNYQWRRGDALLVVTASSFGFSKVVGANRAANNQYGEYYRLNLGYRLTELPIVDLGNINILGKQMDVLPTIPPPSCDFATLRAAAASQGVPKTALATVVYRADYLAGGGALYEVSAGAATARVGADCKPQLN